MNPYLLVIFFSLVSGDTRNHMWPNRTTIVHLFEWKWRDIADECERFLGPKGYGAVQISPPAENLIVHANGGRPWYERYQVMSYNLVTRSGNRDDFLDMTQRCNNVGVRIYADVVVNHMTSTQNDNVGTAGSTADFNNKYYPAVPYTSEHFHPTCDINYNYADQIRNCELAGLKDLNQGLEHVRDKIVEYFNDLISLGVAGLRVDAAKHIWPSDLSVIYNRLNNLNTDFGFSENARAYIYQEVSYYGFEVIKPDEYLSIGDVIEFRLGAWLKYRFRGENPLSQLNNWGTPWGLSPSESALVFIDNHDTQRTDNALSFKEPRAYKAAVAFMLAHPYGNTRIMSSFYFDDFDQGPPSDDNENILTPQIVDDSCVNGWVCEHRWRQIYQMVVFRNAVGDAALQNWWDNGNNQIAFGRGNRGFIVFNAENGASLDQTLQTGLPAGDYCDVISGTKSDSSCSGTKITVGSDGLAHFYIPANAEDVHVAIHVGPESKI